MMKTFLFLLILSFSNFSFGSDLLMSSKEFLKKVDKKEVLIEKSPVIANVPPEYIKVFLESQKKAYPNFKEEMLFMGTVSSRDYTYVIMYEWYGKGCVFGVKLSRKMKPITDAFMKSTSESEKESLNKQAYHIAIEESKLIEPIDAKYCEQVLKITLPSSKGLFELPSNLQKP